MKPVLNDKTVLRLQEATGHPISRGVDKTINSILDQLNDLKENISADCHCTVKNTSKVSNEEKD